MKRAAWFGVVLAVLLCQLAYASAAHTGGVHGRVTWQYSKFIEQRNMNGMPSSGLNIKALQDKEYARKRGDAGAKIELIPVTFDKNSITEDQEQAWYRDNVPPPGKNIFFAPVNQEGYYEIYGVPAGDYMLLIVSRKSKETYTYPEKRMLRYIRNWEYFDYFVLAGGEYSLRKITIQAGKTLTADRNFEYTVTYGYVGNE